MSEWGVKIGYVTSYVNPDTDGVACSIAYATLLSHLRSGVRYEPVEFGDLNAETLLVLERFGWDPPRVVDTLDPSASIILVDTHHPTQLAPAVSLDAVIEVLDHHPGGVPDAFPNAKIVNEPVGAAATLIVEHWAREIGQIEPRLAGLLGAAIVSNTLNLRAPTTTDRDHAALAWLSRYQTIDDDLIDAMSGALDTQSSLDTDDLLRSDFKIFETSTSTLGISQIETSRASNVMERKDLTEGLRHLKDETIVDYCFLSVVDLALGWTHIVSADASTTSLLVEAISLDFDDEGVAHQDRLMLRKSDFVPQLKALLDARATSY